LKIAFAQEWEKSYNNYKRVAKGVNPVLWLHAFILVNSQLRNPVFETARCVK
jgi:hypothetical protein